MALPKIVTPNLKNRISDPTYVYTSYSGADIVAQVVLPNEPPLVLGELQTISWSTHRENTPVRFLGHVMPSGWLRGPRTIAGSMIFTTFNKYVWYRLKQMQLAINNSFNLVWPLGDMLPPFDVAISFQNETGSFSKMTIYGINIVDEGGTMSIDDLITEHTVTYMARGIRPMVNFDPFNPGSAGPVLEQNNPTGPITVIT